MTELRCAHCDVVVRRSVGGLLWRDDSGFRFCWNVPVGEPARLHHPAPAEVGARA